jgi:dipeptidyl aminopeptidase/acylaminoacyl peptidase
VTELREVFEVVRNQTEPNVDVWWEEQEQRQGRASRNRKFGAIAFTAGLVIATAWLVLRSSEVTDQSKVIQEPASIGMTLPSRRGLYFLDLATGRVTGGPRFAALGARHAVVSPDGSKVAFVGIDEDLDDAIFVAKIDGTNPRPLAGTATMGTLMAPQWSPDGAKITYQAKGTGLFVGDLFIVDVPTGRSTRLTHLDPVSSPLWWMGPRFSPDGEAVLFTFPRDELGQQSWDLWSVPVSGGKPTLVRQDAAGGSLSPDARTIAYIQGSGLFGDLWLADADGTDARPLVTGEGELAPPRWSPDGSKIAYADQGRGGTYIVDVGTGETTRVLDATYRPEWLDDQTLIFYVD